MKAKGEGKGERLGWLRVRAKGEDKRVRAKGEGVRSRDLQVPAHAPTPPSFVSSDAACGRWPS